MTLVIIPGSFELSALLLRGIEQYVTTKTFHDTKRHCCQLSGRNMAHKKLFFAYFLFVHLWNLDINWEVVNMPILCLCMS